MCERQLVDPENKYDFGGPLKVDHVARQVLELLPGATLERTRDVIQFEVREDLGLVLLVKESSINRTRPHYFRCVIRFEMPSNPSKTCSLETRRTSD
jgi:hypothetical protein